MLRGYKFQVGQKVCIHTTPSASVGCKAHDGEVVTIKARCKFTWAYELEELPNLWSESCFKPISAAKTFTCFRCKEVYTEDDLEELREMDERYYKRYGHFMCPDCYDDYRRLPLAEKASIVERLRREERANG